MKLLTRQKDVISIKDDDRDLREVSAMEYNVYCDESCHLEHDREKVMGLGAIWCPKESTRQINDEIRDIKRKHSTIPGLEAKWVKVSKGKIDFYKDIVTYFFTNDKLHFRVLIVPDKRKLRHEKFMQDHNTWYYKMYYEMLNVILHVNDSYNIYLDIKDTIGGEKVRELNEVLLRSKYDKNNDIVKKLQIVRSDEIEIMQITDLLIGAAVYANRKKFLSEGKVEIVNLIQKKFGYELDCSTHRSESKFNILVWQGR